jgi:hypothetical protein
MQRFEDAKDLSGKIVEFKNGMSRDLLERVFKYNNLSNIKIQADKKDRSAPLP